MSLITLFQIAPFRSEQRSLREAHQLFGRRHVEGMAGVTGLGGPQAMDFTVTIERRQDPFGPLLSSAAGPVGHHH